MKVSVISLFGRCQIPVWQLSNTYSAAFLYMFGSRISKSGWQIRLFGMRICLSDSFLR